MTQREALETIEDATASIRYFKEQIEREERRLFNAKLVSGLYMMAGNGNLVRVEAA